VRTIPYSSVERGLAAIAGIDSENLLAHEQVQFAEYINDATKFVWEHYPWPETIRVEKRYFRPLWVEGQNYEIGDEVFFKDKYYRKFANYEFEITNEWDEVSQAGSTSPISDWDDASRVWFPRVGTDEESVWHEIGDDFQLDEWTEAGLYKVGAFVTYENENYICVKNPDVSLGPFYIGTRDLVYPDTAYVNYSQNGITIHNTHYWQKVDKSFDRYIEYDQEGLPVIGTLISVHVDDPRYNSGTPLNWELGREGVYIDLPLNTNEVWLRFKEEPPVYSSGEETKGVLSYLAPSIKALAYRSFLVSDGQNEKALLQEQHAYDLILKEMDKLNHQNIKGN
jgi:hypothetical protein